MWKGVQLTPIQKTGRLLLMLLQTMYSLRVLSLFTNRIRKWRINGEKNNMNFQKRIKNLISIITGKFTLCSDIVICYLKDHLRFPSSPRGNNTTLHAKVKVVL